MSERLPSMFANIDDRIAKPGDPDLDLHLTGLRVASVVVLPADGLTEVAIDFATDGAAGFWVDPSTGERFFPDRVTMVEITGGFGMKPGSRWLLDVMIGRLEAWRSDAALVAATGAPGKWTLLHCPQHPEGAMVPMPRAELTGKAASDAEG